MAFGGCVGLWAVGAPDDRTWAVIRSEFYLVVDGGSSDRAELHSALHNAGAQADDREPIGRVGWVWFGPLLGGRL